MAKSGQQEFRVVIEGLDLEDAQVEQLNASVQRAVLNEIARFRVYSEFIVHLPKDWIGLMIRPQVLFEEGPVDPGSMG